MADQTVKIEGDSGSAAKVAYDLMTYIRTAPSNETKTRQEILDLYAECLEATRGMRGYEPNVRTL